MDLRLGTSSGIDAVREIRREYPSARVIVLTMYRGDEDIHPALSAAIRMMFTEPVRRWFLRR